MQNNVKNSIIDKKEKKAMSKKIIISIIVVILIGIVAFAFYASYLNNISYAISKYGSSGKEVKKTIEVTDKELTVNLKGTGDDNKAINLAYIIIKNHKELTEEETAVYHRGRNAKSYTSAKNASIADYRKATGMEALLGYLYLRGETDRLLMLVHRAFDKLEMEI